MKILNRDDIIKNIYDSISAISSSEMETILDNILSSRDENLIRFFYNKYQILLIKNFHSILDKWLIPKYIYWEIASAAFHSYDFYHIYNFTKVWYPNFYIFNKDTVLNLIFNRMKYYHMWINIVDVYLKKYLPDIVYYFIKNNKQMTYGDALQIYKSTSPHGLRYLNFISRYTGNNLEKQIKFCKSSYLL